MPLPNVNASIRNVPMDYFLRGVDAAKPQGAPPAGAVFFKIPPFYIER